MKYKKLKGKRYLKVPVLHERATNITLTYHDLLVYAYLTYRIRLDQGASQAEIARMLDIDQFRTLPRVRDRLLEHRLIERRDKLYAVEPTGLCKEWFRFRHDAEDKWFDAFVYDYTFIPTADARQDFKLTHKVNALFWRLYRLAQPIAQMRHHLAIAPNVKSKPPFLTNSYLVHGLRFDPATVSNGLTTLEQIGLIRVMEKSSGFCVGIPPLTGDHLSLWSDKEEESDVVSIAQLFGFPEPIAAKPAPSESVRVKALKRHRIPKTVSQKLLTMADDLSLSHREFLALLHQCAVDHERNKDKQLEAGGKTVDHPGYLLRHELQRRLDEQRAKQQESAPDFVDRDDRIGTQRLRNMGFQEKHITEVRRAINVGQMLEKGKRLPVELSWSEALIEAKASNGDSDDFWRRIVKRLQASRKDCENSS